jgi:hypothetical protein
VTDLAGPRLARRREEDAFPDGGAAQPHARGECHGGQAAQGQQRLHDGAVRQLTTRSWPVLNVIEPRSGTERQQPLGVARRAAERLELVPHVVVGYSLSDVATTAGDVHVRAR